MKKVKKALTAAQKRNRKAARAARRKEYAVVFMNGKQVRVKRPPALEGTPIDQFILENADPLWLHQNEMWELLPNDQGSFALEDRE
jgi:hypothetical protein